MTFLEFAQTLFYLTFSVVALIILIFAATLGVTLMRIARKVEHSIDAFHKGSAEIKEKVSHFFSEISLVTLAAKVNSWFNKKKKKN